MKAILSLWTKTPAFKLTLDAAIMFSAAAAYAQRAYPDNELVTDIQGLRIADRLGWDFTAYSVALENFCPENQKHIWAMGKVEACSFQTKSFFHIDFDFFLYEKFTRRIERARMAVQGKDEPEFYQSKEAQALMSIAGVPGWTVGYNAGLTLWNDLKLRDEYVCRAKQAAERMAQFSRNGTMLSIIAEQGVLGQVLRERAVKPACLIPMASLAHPSDFDQQFTHFWGRCKTLPEVNARIRARFKRDFPDLYAKSVFGYNLIERQGLGSPFSAPYYYRGS